MSIPSIRPMPVVAPVRQAAPAKPAAPVAQAAPVAKPTVRPMVEPVQHDWTVGRALKAAGSGVAGFFGGACGTFVADLFFHFGNNGGTAWSGGVYTTVAVLAAAAAVALYAQVSKK